MQLTTPTIYIIDDDEGVRDALGLMIASEGNAVEGYANADDFLQGCQPNEIGCILLDIRMPGLSGLALQQRLASNRVPLPIIFITGHGDVEQCARAFRQGAVDFITKPVNKQQLMDSLRRAIRQSIARQERQLATREAAERLARLSEREYAVLTRVTEGLSSKEIGKALDLSPRTIETHRASLFAKLEVTTLAELIRLYLDAPKGTSGPATQ